MTLLIFLRRIVLCSMLSVFMFSGCASQAPAIYQPELLDELHIIRQNLDSTWVSIPGPENPSQVGQLTGALAVYRSYFGFENTGMLVSYVDGGNHEIFTLILPAATEIVLGTVFIVHGYRAHSGHFAEQAHVFTQAGWMVCLMDLPGHGLSSGERYAISDFEVYGQTVLNVWRELCLQGWIDPKSAKIFLGHSTGGTALSQLMGFLASQAAAPVLPDKYVPDALVLGAPLFALRGQNFRVRLNRMISSESLTIPDFLLVPGWYDEGYSCNPAFKNFMLFGDPMHLPLYNPTWLSSFYRWYEQNHDTTLSFSIPVLLLQGTNDSVVDWSMGSLLFERLFINSQIVLLEGYSHALFNTKHERAAVVNNRLLLFLEEIRQSKSSSLDKLKNPELAGQVPTASR